MPESADDPMAELFRHGSTHAQTLITGAARIMDQRQLRTNQVLQDRARYEAFAAERARAETAVLAGVDTARRRQHTALIDQADTAADLAGRRTAGLVGTADLVGAAYPTGVAATAAAATTGPHPGRPHQPAAMMPSNFQPGIGR